jgi:uncharacterized protein
MIGAVGALWRYPVKSLQGSICRKLRLEPDGVDGDRRWALVAHGKALSAKQVPELLLAEAAIDRDDVVITLPDGQRVRGSALDAGERLSDWLGQAVELVTRVHEPWVDDAPVHVLSTGSLRTMRGTHPGDWDVRRFRPNIVVVTEAQQPVEDLWVGKRLRVGRVVLEIRMRTVRCVMTGHRQPGLPEDLRVLAALGATGDPCLGVYADVVRPGVVRVGDRVDVAAE